MVTQTLDKKYRPKIIDDVIGNSTVKETLKSIFRRKNSIPASFLLRGPSGCGKTTIARIIADRIGAGARDTIQLNISDTRGIDAARDLIQSAKLMPLESRKKVFILDEVHSSTKDFQNAILTILEEPPQNVHFILCTTEPEKLLKTIRTRCVDLQVSSLGRRDLPVLLNRVLELEGVKDFPEEAIQLIIKHSEGCPRKALLLLDKVIDIEEDKFIIEGLQSNIFTEAEVIDLCRALMNGTWKEITKMLNGLTAEPEQVRYAVLGYLSKVLLNKDKLNTTVLDMMNMFDQSYVNSGKVGLTLSCGYAYAKRTKQI